MKKFLPKQLASILFALTCTLTVWAQIVPPPTIVPGMEVLKVERPLEQEVSTSTVTLPQNHIMVYASSQKVATGLKQISRTDEPDFQFAIVPGEGYAVVYKCLSNAEELTIPDAIEYNGQTYPVQVLYKQSFAAKSSLKTLTFGANVKKIDTQVFLANSALSTINLNEGLIEIGDNAFYMFVKNLKEITLPSTVETIGETAFVGCALTGEFIINKKLKSIGGGAFSGNQITGFYINEDGNDYFTSKDGVLYTKDGQSLVIFPPALVEPTLIIPEGTQKLAPYALSNCSKVTKIIAPSSLQEIGKFAFRNCNLAEFTIGANVKKIGEGVFQGNKNLKSLTLDNGNTAFTLTDGMLIDKEAKTLVAVKYDVTNINVPNGVDSIAPYLCYGNTTVTSFIATASVTKIGAYAFYGNTSLASLQFPGVKIIGSYAFRGLNKVEKIIFPASLRLVNIAAFAASTGLKEIQFQEGLDSIGGLAFNGCTDLEKANIPGSTKKMGDAIFFQCTKLGELSLGEGMPYIPQNMAYGCEKLYYCTLPSTIKEIRDGAFSFSWLQEVSLPEGLLKIGNASFQLSCIKAIDLPNSVVSVGDLGLSITNAEYIKCGTGLKRLGSNALQGNRKAAYIKLNEGLEFLDFRALYGEELIDSIIVPSTVTHIGDSCFLMTPLKALVNLNPTPQSLSASILGMPIVVSYNPTPHDLWDVCTLYVPSSSIDAYKSANIWKLFENIEGINNSVSEIGYDDSDYEISEIFTIDGCRRENLMPGVNICRCKNGKIRKIIVR